MSLIASDLAAVLLAGGRSTRMGRDKALLDWQGGPLWCAQLGKLMELNPARLLLSCREEQEFKTNFAQIVCDPPDNPGPLGVIIRCLELTRLPLLTLAVDMPRMTVDFLRAIIEESDIERGLVCAGPNNVEPLCAVYPELTLPVLRAALDEGCLQMQVIVARLVERGLMRVWHLRDEELPLFSNVNTPEEYAWTKTAPPASN